MSIFENLTLHMQPLRMPALFEVQALGIVCVATEMCAANLLPEVRYAQLIPTSVLQCVNIVFGIE